MERPNTLILIAFSSYILASTALTGTLAYTFATVLQEPTASIIPALAAFSTYVCKVTLQKQLAWPRDFQNAHGACNFNRPRSPAANV
jgi:hypothetical protein